MVTARPDENHAEDTNYSLQNSGLISMLNMGYNCGSF